MSSLITFDYSGLKKVISGGQVGADRGGLEAARSLGIETGGWAPRGWRVDGGFDPSLESFGLVQTISADYPTRTKKNVTSSDGTLIIASNLSSPGVTLTRRYCRKALKPFYEFDFGRYDASIQEGIDWIIENQIEILNVAGNRRGQSMEVKAFQVGSFQIVERILIGLLARDKLL